MARIVLADDGLSFDGDSIDADVLRGNETTFILLAEALARRGHDVTAYNMCLFPLDRRGVKWRPLEWGLPCTADLYIANRGHRLLGLVPEARRMVFWLHNPATYLLKWRYLMPLWRRRPTIVFTGRYHKSTYPAWAPSGARKIIPHGISDHFMEPSPDFDLIPPPQAIFVSNPLRSLEWLLDIWVRHVVPQVPKATLQIFAADDHPAIISRKNRERAAQVLGHARSLADSRVLVRPPVTKADLAREFQRTRVIPYRGDAGETFCLALGEAQAMGIPAVVQAMGSVVERVIDGVTGYVTRNDDEFVLRLVALLRDDGLWRAQRREALNRQRQWTWDKAAAEFEQLLP